VLVEYPAQGRNGGGVVTHKPTSRTGNVVTALILKEAAQNEVAPDEMLALITRKGVAKPVALTEIPAMGRGVQGKPVVEISGSDTIVAIKRIGGAMPSATGVKEIDSDSDNGKNGAGLPVKPALRPSADGAAVVTKPTKVQPALKMVTAKPDPRQLAPRPVPEKVTQNGAEGEAKSEKSNVRAKADGVASTRSRRQETSSEPKAAASKPDKDQLTVRLVQGKSPQRRTEIATKLPQSTSRPGANDPPAAQVKPGSEAKIVMPMPEQAPRATRPTPENVVQARNQTEAKSAKSAPDKTTNGAAVTTPHPKAPTVQSGPAAHLRPEKMQEKGVQNKSTKVNVTKGFTQPELTQPALFGGEVEAKPATERTHQAKKVQTVVSVPLSQAAKGKKAR
jgi:hypothetical protein